jgi:hypothetical protein
MVVYLILKSIELYVTGSIAVKKVKSITIHPDYVSGKVKNYE